MIASEYGWTKDYIYYNLYFDELFELLTSMKKRKNADYLVQLAISSNPHSEDPKALWKLLSEEDEINEDVELDVAAFDRMKMAMSKNPRIIVK